MTVAYKELTGSPVEKYDAGGMTATRLFICAWADRNSFVQEILGTGYESGISDPVAYPGASSVLAIKVKVEPLADDLEIQDLGDLAGGLNAYQGFAKVTVSYEKQIASSTLNVVASIASQSTFIYSTELTYDTLTIPGGNLYLPGNTQVAFPSGAQGTVRIPVTKHLLTWSGVSNPPWTAIRNCKGTWNNAAFLGAAAGTLLFDGAKAKGLFSSISGLSECPSGCDLEYTFRENPLAAQSSVNLFSTSDFALLLQAENQEN
ncbi:MAG: hypothetical protein ABSA77_02970 [Thermoguttaceae bacterium]|jgi:hypothetical protein